MACIWPANNQRNLRMANVFEAYTTSMSTASNIRIRPRMTNVLNLFNLIVSVRHAYDLPMLENISLWPAYDLRKHAGVFDQGYLPYE